MTSSYVTLDDHKRPGMHLEQFGRDLAAALGFPVEVDNPGSSYPHVTINCGEGLTIFLRAEYGAKVGKVELFAGTGAARNLEQHERPQLPSAGVDSSRDIALIAKDVTRRIVDPSRALVAATIEAANARATKCDSLKDLAASLMAKYPGLSITTQANNLRADVYFNSAGCYLNGSMGVDGHLNIQRLSLGTAAQTEALFALIANAKAEA